MTSLLAPVAAAMVAILAAGCASSVESSTVTTTTSAMLSVSTSNGRAALKRSRHLAGLLPAYRPSGELSLRATARWKSRCESGDDAACRIANNFER